MLIEKIMREAIEGERPAYIKEEDNDQYIIVIGRKL